MDNAEFIGWQLLSEVEAQEAEQEEKQLLGADGKPARKPTSDVGAISRFFTQHS